MQWTGIFSETICVFPEDLGRVCTEKYICGTLTSTDSLERCWDQQNFKMLFMTTQWVLMFPDVPGTSTKSRQSKFIVLSSALQKGNFCYSNYMQLERKGVNLLDLFFVNRYGLWNTNVWRTFSADFEPSQSDITYLLCTSKPVVATDLVWLPVQMCTAQAGARRRAEYPIILSISRRPGL